MTEKMLLKPVTELAEAIHKGEISSEELVTDSLKRIEQLNPQLGAFNLVDPEGAIAEAKQIEPKDPRPFAGVPIAIKDLGPPLAGKPLTFGSEIFGDFVPGHDGNVTARIKRAGFVVMGKTNTPELGILPVTEPRRFGPSRNPWNPELTPGGSSGGSAAAVASGMVPVAHGNDGGGSLRIPAACCGLVGLKPSRGRVSPGPELGDSFLSIDGFVTRTVSETAVLLDVLEGYELGDANWAPPPSEPFGAAVDREPKQLKIALALNPPLDVELDPICADAARKAAEMLESLGHKIEEVTLPSAEAMMSTFTNLWAAGIAFMAHFGTLVSGRQPNAETLEPLSLEFVRMGRSLNAIELQESLIGLQAYSRGLIGWSSQYDALITPALAKLPVPIGTIDSCNEEDPMRAFREAAAFAPFTAIWNVTGQPAVSLPIYRDSTSGLPVAAQIIGRPADEGRLLALAKQLEQSTAWHSQQPVPELASGKAS